MNSDAVQLAEKYIRSNPSIIDEVGEIKSITLSPFDYELGFSGSRGSADFTFWVEGINGETDVNLQLEMRLNIWNIKKVYFVSQSGKVLELL